MQIVPFDEDYGFTAQERGCIPVDDRTNIVLVKNPVEPFGINLCRLLMAAHKIVGSSRAQLLTTGVEVLVMPPHGLSSGIVWMLAVDVLYPHSNRSPRSPTRAPVRHSCHSR